MACGSYSFPDPIHGRVILPAQFRELIEHPVLARLRNVRQLGFTPIGYPGAVHTRFEHTIGTCAILGGLLDQCGVSDAETRARYLRAALLSEIGIYPLSYSSRAAFVEVGVEKKKMAADLLATYLGGVVGSDEKERRFYVDRTERRESWFQPVLRQTQFGILDPVSLASMIDYVLRDGHYTGRRVGGFDYRFFGSLSDLNGDGARSLPGSLYALHQAAHALNVVYGDPRRRIMSEVLLRLLRRLREKGHLSLRELSGPARYVELDDDEFLRQIGLATRNASVGGDELSSRMFEVLLEKRQLREIEPGEVLQEETERAEAERLIAIREGVEPEAVLVFGGWFDRQVGFRLFGTEYKDYTSAIDSDAFRCATGLTREAALATVPEHWAVQVLVIPSG